MRRRGKEWRKRGGSKGKKGLDEKWRNSEEKKRRGADDKGTERGWGGECKRWRKREGGYESSPGSQPWWAGLLWGWQCDTYAETHTHTHRGIPAVMPLMSPPAVEAGGRQYRVTTGTHSSHTLSSSPSLSDTHTHIMMMAERKASLRLWGWMYGWMYGWLYTRAEGWIDVGKKKGHTSIHVMPFCTSHIFFPSSFIFH